MKLGFNEANDRFCANHSVMMDLELCEKYGFDCIDIQSECLNRDLEAGKITLEEMGAWFQSHHLKMLSYNALCFFNMKQTQEEKDAVMAELDEIIRRCNILGCKMIVVVPSKDMKERGLTPTRKEIREDAVAVLKEMVKKCGATRYPPEPRVLRRAVHDYQPFRGCLRHRRGGQQPVCRRNARSVPLLRNGLRLGYARKGRRQEDFRMASERHRGHAVRRTTTTTRSVCGRVPRATACRMRATQIPSRRLALTATAAPSRFSVRHTMRCRRREGT